MGGKSGRGPGVGDEDLEAGAEAAHPTVPILTGHLEVEIKSGAVGEREAEAAVEVAAGVDSVYDWVVYDMRLKGDSYRKIEEALLKKHVSKITTALATHLMKMIMRKNSLNRYFDSLCRYDIGLKSVREQHAFVLSLAYPKLLKWIDDALLIVSDRLGVVLRAQQSLKQYGQEMNIYLTQGLNMCRHIF